MSGFPAFNFTTVAFKDSLGSSVGDLSIDIYLAQGSFGSLGINLRCAQANSGDKPNSTYSYVDSKYLEMIGGATVDKLVLHWSDSESSGLNESSFKIWSYQDSWIEDITSSGDISGNTITATDVDTADVFFGDSETFFGLFETSPLESSLGEVPEFSTWTLLIGLMVVMGGFLVIRRQE